MEASWQPDPTGRHQYRWWDGAGWTDSVADDGQTSVDPLGGGGGAPATVIAGAQPPVIGPASGPTSGPVQQVPPVVIGSGAPLPDYSTTPTTPAKAGGKAKWIALAIVVVAALGVGGFLIFGGSDDGGSSGGTGRFEYELTDDERLITHEIPMKAGDVVRIRVEPARNLDTRSGVIVTADDVTEEVSAGIEFYSEFFSDSDFDEALTDFFSDARDVFSDGLEGDLRRGYGYILNEDGDEGEPDTGGIIALTDSTYVLVIGSYNRDENGKVVVYVERYDGDEVTDFDDLTDLASDDPFFTDTDFYTDSGPYRP